MKPKVITFYDPFKNVYCDMAIEKVEKLIEEAKKVEKQLKDNK